VRVCNLSYRYVLSDLPLKDSVALLQDSAPGDALRSLSKFLSLSFPITCRTVSGASNTFLLFLMCQEMVSYKRMVLYIPYKKDKNRRDCKKIINLDQVLYKGGSYSWGWESTTDNTVAAGSMA
jgi:hypothetical protein